MSNILAGPDYVSAVYNPNVSYGMSSADEYSPGYRSKSDNVNEYLKLAAHADKQQLQRIKAVFEKKNQKSALCIQHGTSGQSHRQPREVLRDMGQGLKNVGGNIRDGITGLGGSVMAAPREFAHLFSRSNRFGSADNIAHLAGLCHTLYYIRLKPILNELRERRDDYERLADRIDSFKNLPQEVSFLAAALQEERFKTERLEEQINDLTELHQNEVENLKQALTDVEEKVQYQSEERMRDIHEALDLCQTKSSSPNDKFGRNGGSHGAQAVAGCDAAVRTSAAQAQGILIGQSREVRMQVIVWLIVESSRYCNFVRIKFSQSKTGNSQLILAFCIVLYCVTKIVLIRSVIMYLDYLIFFLLKFNKISVCDPYFHTQNWFKTINY
ncbi:unnamed protein product, partial [Leptidea sinapis]